MSSIVDKESNIYTTLSHTNDFSFNCLQKKQNSNFL
jgi:hypothetical protein